MLQQMMYPHANALTLAYVGSMYEGAKQQERRRTDKMDSLKALWMKENQLLEGQKPQNSAGCLA